MQSVWLGSSSGERGPVGEVKTKAVCTSKMRDIFFLRGCLPCPQHLKSNFGMQLRDVIPEVRQMVLDFIELLELDLVCVNLTVCCSFRNRKYSTDGCWLLTLGGCGGNALTPEHDSVRALHSHLLGVKDTFPGNGTVTIRIIIPHQYC